ncbi:TDP-N-acetylfucosamine:lipid II N-acetylfucosaminyltransferase [uncultured Brachyspira sp.]|uniref:TDP-N-acetylfucosamine:lipid II N-acetylfucosaminyltransferase n=1 Tax=uncultured Brachyspira sp. TaxID=221953 RepID=UPI00262560D2|nr:TDP-N-acetylfucosamine:lipid II N-acetylfucosaminyltransferase [uncultured Brachyspira sp.]
MIHDMLINVFDVRAFYLNFRIIKSFQEILNSTSVNNIYVIYGQKEPYQNKYETFFIERNISSYIFIDNIFLLYEFVLKHKKFVYLLHGLPYPPMFVFWFARVKTSWVCWGHGASINKKNIKSILFTPIKTILYRYFTSVSVLMTGDKTSLEKDYGLKNITLTPYPQVGNFQELYKQLLENTVSESKKKIVILGPNAHNICNYYNLIDLLSNYKDKIIIRCMLQYPKLPSSEIKELADKGHEIFDKDFIIDTTFLKFEDYINYINNCDIYICGKDTQSGLGAIYTSLKLGKKIYLTGKNLDWIKSSGYIVFNIEDIKEDPIESVLHPLTLSEKLYNYNLQININNRNKQIWIDYIKKLTR